MTTRHRVDNLIRHIEHVKDNCFVVGMKLIEQDQPLGRVLIANSFIHDNSKFHGIEWEYLTGQITNPEHGKLAIHQHNTTNPHHPEFWGGIHLMPEVYVAEMVCDWAARSTEFGTSLQDWIVTGAATRYKYSNTSQVFNQIKYYASLLCDKPFSAL